MSLEFEQQITLDLTVQKVQNVHCSEDDKNSRNIVIQLTDKGKPYNVSDEKLYFKLTKPDGNYVYIDEDDTEHLYKENGKIVIILSDQATAVGGICKSEIQLKKEDSNKNEHTITTINFNIIVKKSVLSDDAIISKIESNVLNKLTNHVDDYSIHVTPDDKNNWNDTNSKKHTHSNKLVLDGITSTLVNTWNKVTDKLDKTGNASNVTNTISKATTRENLTTGEKLSVSLGKISKWFSDLKDVAFTGNAEKVNGHTVKSDVPENAEFTDTKYNLNDMINGLGAAISVPQDADYYVCQYAGGGTKVQTYHRRPISALWSYIKSKADKAYSALGHKHTKSEITDFPKAMPANGGDSSTVNGHTVNSNVPANAKFTDTTYNDATTTSSGLMSADDKTTIENLKNGAVTGIKGNAETKYRTGNVEITPENLGLGTMATKDADDYDLRAYGHKAIYATCSTEASIVDKQIDIVTKPYTVPQEGDIYVIVFTHGNTAAGATFTIPYFSTNVSYSAWFSSDGSAASSYIVADVPVAFVYNGSTFDCLGLTRHTTDSTKASALSMSKCLVTERDVYYGTPKINNSHAYTSNSVFYAPVSAGTKGYMLESSGGTSAPVWKSNPCRCYSEIISVTFTNGQANVKKDLTTLDGFTGVYDAKFQAWGAALYIVSYVTDGTLTSYRHQLAIVDGGTYSGTIQVKATYFYN